MKIKARIKIANPQPGGAKYTSVRRAEHYLKRGYAELTEDGCLFFLERRTVERNRDRLISSVYSWANRESGQSLGGNGVVVKQAERSVRKR